MKVRQNEHGRLKQLPLVPQGANPGRRYFQISDPFVDQLMRDAIVAYEPSIVWVAGASGDALPGRPFAPTTSSKRRQLCSAWQARSINCNGFSSDIRAGKPGSSPSRAWISMTFHWRRPISYRSSTQKGASLIPTALTAPRPMTVVDEGFLVGKRYLLMDRDTKFSGNLLARSSSCARWTALGVA
jgi:hypothetical protein